MIVKNCTLIKPLSCTKDTNIVDIAKILKKHEQRRIIVVNDNDAPIGIISVTDMNNDVVAENKDLSKTTAADVMTAPIFLMCDLNDDLNMLYRQMIEHESFFVPVTKKGKLHGILTYAELMRRVNEKFRETKK